MPWDPLLPAEFSFPSISHNVLTNTFTSQEPSTDWLVVPHWTPLKTSSRERREFFNTLPREVLSTGQSITLCSTCGEIIMGYRYFCRDCTDQDFNWCWSCMADSSNAHPLGHALVRIAPSMNQQEYTQRNDAARKLTFEALPQRETNAIIHVTADCTHEVRNISPLLYGRYN